jgi:O-antigen/teichoic acid export membrane protein
MREHRLVDGPAGAQSNTPPSGLPLSSNFLWAIGGNVFYAACQWGILVVVAKVGNAIMLGELALALAIAAPIFMAANLNLRSLLATDATDKYSFREYMALLLISLTVAIMIIALLVAFTNRPLHVSLLILVVALSKAIEGIGDMYYGVYQRADRMDYSSISMMIKGICSLSLMYLLLLTTGSLLLSVFGMALGYAVPLLLRDMRLCRQLDAASRLRDALSALRIPARRHLVKSLLFVAFPLAILGAVHSFSQSMPKYFLEHHLGAYELGIFAALAYLIVAGSTVVRASGQAVCTRLGRHYVGGRVKPFLKLIVALAALGAGIGLGGVLIAHTVGGPVLRIIYNQDIAAHAPLFTRIMVASIFHYMSQMMDFAVIASRRLVQMLVLSFVSCAVTTIVCIIDIPVHGLAGGANAILAYALCRVLGNGLILALACWRLPARRAGSL